MARAHPVNTRNFGNIPHVNLSDNLPVHVMGTTRKKAPTPEGVDAFVWCVRAVTT